MERAAVAGEMGKPPAVPDGVGGGESMGEDVGDEEDERSGVRGRVFFPVELGGGISTV